MDSEEEFANKMNDALQEEVNLILKDKRFRQMIEFFVLMGAKRACIVMMNEKDAATVQFVPKKENLYG